MTIDVIVKRGNGDVACSDVTNTLLTTTAAAIEAGRQIINREASVENKQIKTIHKILEPLQMAMYTDSFDASITYAKAQEVRIQIDGVKVTMVTKLHVPTEAIVIP